MKRLTSVKTPGRPLSRHTKKKMDQWSVSSKVKLIKFCVHKMKRMYVSTLNELDQCLSSGSMDKHTHAVLRSKILDVANDQIRNLQNELEARYNVEFIPYHIEMKVLDGAEGNDEEG